MSKKCILHAPISGVLIPIEKVPDPAFAQKMIGDGFSIDPIEGLLRAPCNGTVAHIHDSMHAVTIQTPDDLEVLLHIGIDTVNLKGAGFQAEVKVGEDVQTGDPLIAFDMVEVSKQAPYLLTQVLVSNMDRVEAMELAKSGEVKAGDALCTVFIKEVQASEAGLSERGPLASADVIIPNPLGLHARPAALLAHFAKTFTSSIELIVSGRSGNAKSVTSIMKLDTRMNDRLMVKATGADAERAVMEVCEQIRSGLGEDIGEVFVKSDAVEDVQPHGFQPLSEDVSELSAIPASGGKALGNVFILKECDFSYPEDAGRPEDERLRLDEALEQAGTELKALHAEFEQSDPQKAAIFSAHLEIIEDPEIRDSVMELIRSGKSAEYAWNRTCMTQAGELAALNSELLAARAVDLKDVAQRVLGLLLGVDRSLEVPGNAIIIAEEMTPSMTAQMDPERVKGFCTVTGGATSHVAILAKALGIPALVGINPAVMGLENGRKVIIDGFSGTLKLKVDEDTAARFLKEQQEVEQQRALDLKQAFEPATTADGRNIEVGGNAGTAAEVLKMVELGGEGIGLLRSEFLFVNRATAPTEEEQFEAYRAILVKAGKDRRVIIRTLDVGGDKPLAYLPLPKEENPFLGQRGVRVSLRYPDVFRTQLRALLRASGFGRLQIMFPMVSGLGDWRDAKAILDEEREKLGVESVPVGVMIEVPSAALVADRLAEEVDFFSIGTNDLTQYTVAIDRGHASLATKADAMDPAVLRLIKMSVEAAHENGKWIGVCGAMGDDPQALPVLIGLGIDELSVSIPRIPTVKAAVRRLDAKRCVELAEQTLRAATAAEARAIQQCKDLSRG